MVRGTEGGKGACPEWVCTLVLIVVRARVLGVGGFEGQKGVLVLKLELALFYIDLE